VLYEQNLRDYAAAIYHGSRFRRMRPNSPYAEVIRQRMDNCKQELAKDLPLGPVTPQLQREIEKLKRDNQNLGQQIEGLTQQLAIATNRVRVVTNIVYVPTAAPAPAAALSPTSSSLPPAKVTAAKDTVGKASVQPTLKIPVVERPAFQTHTVRARETLAAIARQYGISAYALQKANPGVDARRIKPGQTLKIPAK